MYVLAINAFRTLSVIPVCTCTSIALVPYRGTLQVYYVFEDPPRVRAHTDSSLNASSLSLTTPEPTRTSPGASPTPESTADSDEDEAALPEG